MNRRNQKPGNGWQTSMGYKSGLRKVVTLFKQSG